ncbi:MAG: hypothetical protein AB7F22_10080 [Reyranella sp.]|uniref:hypothetical protein n=1 Tax=Reyranella sp. TaxID=1929291 RepID=UPI003D11AC6B
MSTYTLGTADRRASGFTPTDLAALNDLGAAAVWQQRWSRCQVVHEPYADYMAAWITGADAEAAPNLTIARFKRTGTYALTVGPVVVATASSLGHILPAIWQVHTAGQQEGAVLA